MKRRYPLAYRYRKYIHIREILMLCIVVAAITYIAVAFVNRDKYQIPAYISKQLDFPVLFLKNPAAGATYNEQSAKIATQNDGSKVFSFIINDGSSKVTVAEQAYPEVLIYDKLTNSLNPYSEVGTSYGTVTLGRPKDGGGAQVAVIKYADSTLIFAKPSSDLSDKQWKDLFNAMDIAK